MIQEQASAVLSAIRTIANERQGLAALEEAIRATGEGGLGAAFSEAVKVISAASGRVIVTGIGKSGLVGRKIASTLASTGEPASFVHSAEASHGDLGMVQRRRRPARDFLVGRDAGARADRRFRQALRHPVDRDDRAGRQHARPRGGRLPDDAERARGLPERPCPDHFDDDAARARRRAGDRAARRPGLHRARFPRPSSGRQARGQARPCAGSHAHRRARSAHRRRRANGRGNRRDDVEGLRLRRGVRGRRPARRHHHRRRPAPSPETRFLPRHPGRSS